MTKKEPPSFVQIAVGPNESLYGLDRAGRVWKYIPSIPGIYPRHAFWRRLTDHRGSKDQTKEETT